jgi:DNA (cytosine-5)-methyltransferase 1
MAQLSVGSLCSGIGGIDLGLEQSGMNVVWQSETDPFASKVLHKHWPHVPNLGDVWTINWHQVPIPDVLCAGYPCQPFSKSGKRRGFEDERNLWPAVRNAIGILRPKYVVLENVRGHLTLGGTSVIGDLATIGYDAEWTIISAASLGANHERERLFIVAYPNSCSMGCDGAAQHSCQTGSGRIFNRARKETYDCRSWWNTEPAVDRVADGIPDRVDRLRTLGNAVVPQVASAVGRLIIEDYEERS